MMRLSKAGTANKPYLDAASKIRYLFVMAEMRKITAFISSDLLAGAQHATGLGVSETLRIALQDMIYEWARKGLLTRLGTIDLEADGLTLAMLREMDDEEVGHRAA